MAHLHAVRDRDDHFVINPTTRLLQTESKKITLMKTDHNSERFTFELPRRIEDHDMSVCNRVEVHYINIDAATREKSTGVYEVTDFGIAEDNEEMVMGSWLISRNVTMYAGTLSFVIRFACTTTDNNPPPLKDGEVELPVKEIVDYSWSTGIYTGISISDGICNTEEVVAEYTDILQSWLNTLEEAASEVCMVTDEGTLVNLTDRLSSIEYSLNRQGGNQEVITQKVSALEQADTSLSSRIKTIEDSNPGRDTKITNLETKDTELANAINANAEAITDEATARSQADTALATRVKAIEDSNPGRDTKITNLENADIALGQLINANAEAITAEATARAQAITDEATARSQADTALDNRVKTIEDSNPGRDTKITNLENADIALGQLINANAETINNKIAAIEENPIIIRFSDTFVEQAGETASLYAKAFSKFPKVGDIVIDQSGNMGEVEFIDDDYDYEETRLVEVRILRK